MSFYRDEYKMYVPLSIDHADTNRSSYFFSNRKVVEMVLALVPYFFLMFPLLQGGVKVLPLIIVTLCYGFIYSYFFRFRILEEYRLRNMVNELDANKISGADHFWAINKITGEGIIHYVLDPKVGKELGVVVTFDKGSTVGVPKGNFTRYRESKIELIRELHNQGFDYTWYELPKRQETPEILIEYFNLMTTHENEEFRKLLKLQLDINNIFVNSAEQPYVDYILIRNHSFRTLRRFRQIVQDCVEVSLSKNGYIQNPRILERKGVEHFFEDYLLIDTVDSARIRRGVEVKPFESFAKITRLIRQDGTELPIEFIERFHSNDEKDYMSVESILDRVASKVDTQLARIEKQYDATVKKIKQTRMRDVTTDAEYHVQLVEAEQAYEKEREAVLNPLPQEVVVKEKKPRAAREKEVQERGEEVVPTTQPMHVNMQKQMAERLAKLREQEAVRQQADPEEELSLEAIMRRQKEGE